MSYKKKLIEVALPLEAINTASAREKSIRHGHPSTLHLWWARRPLAAARAVIWSSLVDDPSSHPEMFPTEEAQAAERERLFRILEQLVLWENSNNEDMLNAAKAEIMKSTNGNPPALLDPFAGGGAIPLEAQRLGLEAHASDLNPVAVMINKAMIEIPPKFAGMRPVNPEARARMGSIAPKGAAGLAEDVRYYGEWMKKEAFKRVGHLYPKVKVPAEQGGGEATVIAWIWARTVKCPNPACGCDMPLASSYMLSKKKGKEAYVVPSFQDGCVRFHVEYGKPAKEPNPKKGRGAIFECPVCGGQTTDAYVKSKGKEQQIGAQLMAIVAEGNRGRLYLSPNLEHESAANVPKPENYPEGEMPTNPRWFSPPAFGMTEYNQLFTNRQLTALTTFSDLVAEAQKHAEADAVATGLSNDHIPLSEGGIGAHAYGEAIGVYLAFAVDKLTNRAGNLCPWKTGVQCPGDVFGRQAIPMVWDFAESNVFGPSGSFESMFKNVIAGILSTEYSTVKAGHSKQFDAQSDNGLRDIMISTDPPYYDNIGYADLSDYFYVWMRRALKDTYPKLFRTMLVPKAEELVATPYRFDGSVERARDFFEDGMYRTFCQVHTYVREDIPVTIYYAFKQSESEEDEEEANTHTASTGWETMLSAIIRAGFAITGTWPMRTERENRNLAHGTNALASSIVIVSRKRAENAPICTRREFVNALKRELKPALKELQKANIAPVDLQQSAIGPGMGVYSRYKSVLEAGGEPMGVRQALQLINQELDSYFNEQEGELDRDSRLCVEIFSQCAFNTMKFGDADNMARAKNTSVAKLADSGAIEAARGNVRLKSREEIPEKVDPGEENIWLLTQQLTHAMEKGGIDACAKILAPMRGSNVEYSKALAYRLYSISERKNWAQEGYAYNALIVAWPDIMSRAAALASQAPEQTTFTLE